MPRRRVSSHQAPKPQSVGKMKARQSAKIREIADALISAGFPTIDAQAKILGVGRSTAWTILKSTHKGSGLSAKVISRILAVRQLPPLVRTKVLEYVEEKASGQYGHSAKTTAKIYNCVINEAHRVGARRGGRETSIVCAPKGCRPNFQPG